jgi:hypothetical protein
MSRFLEGDLVRVSAADILRPGEAGIVRAVLENKTGNEEDQEYIVEFGERVMDETSPDGFTLRIHSEQRIHCYLSGLLEDANEPVVRWT